MTSAQRWEVRFPSGCVEPLEPGAPLTSEQERALGSGRAELARLDGRGVPDIVWARVVVYGEPAPLGRAPGEAASGTPLRTILVERSACSVLRVGERFDTVFALDAVLAAARQLLTGNVDQSIRLLLMWHDGTAVRCNLAVGRHRDQHLATQVLRACDELRADGRFGVLHALATNTLERIVATSVAEAGARPFGRPGLEDVPDAQYSEPVVRTTFRFITQGVLRGRCGHSHKTLEGAARCLMKDELWCQAQGGDGHSDRRIFVVGGGTRRELNATELATVEGLRPALAKELTEPSKP